MQAIRKVRSKKDESIMPCSRVWGIISGMAEWR